MIWPFRPRCPLALRNKVELEILFETAARCFGNETLLNKQVITDADLQPVLQQTDPSQWGQTVGAFIAQRLAQPLPHLTITDAQASEFSEADNGERYAAEISSDKQKCSIRIDERLKSTPNLFLGMTAIAVADCYQQMTTDLPQTHEVADLAPLFFGFAPLIANSSLEESAASNASIVSYQLTRFVRFSPEQYGYLMALADWSLGSQHTERAGQLRLDARETLQKSLRYLQKTTDCSLQPGFLDHPEDAGLEVLLAKLQSSSDSTILAALFRIAAGSEPPSEFIEPLRKLVRHPEVDIQELAVHALGTIEDLPEAVHEELFLSIEHATPPLRRAAIAGLRPGYHHDATVQQELFQRLSSSDPRTAVACLQTLFRYGPIPEGEERSLAKAVSRMLRTGDGDLPLAVQFLRTYCDQPDRFIETAFGEDPSAVAILNDIQSQLDAEELPAEAE